MSGLYVLLGVLLVIVALLLFMRRDLRRSATARDDLAEARKAADLETKAAQAEALARAKNEELK